MTAVVRTLGESWLFDPPTERLGDRPLAGFFGGKGIFVGEDPEFTTGLYERGLL